MKSKFKHIRVGFGSTLRHLFTNTETQDIIYVFNIRGKWHLTTQLGVILSKEEINEIQQLVGQDTHEQEERSGNK